jgi:tetratricopeptide (TPR) repeat protein
VLAALLAAWVADPAASRLLITSRFPFTLPGRWERSLSFRHLGALSRAETMKLAWSLPALDRLDEGQLDQVWRLVGGHPRSLEYLDALLSGGTARYPDVTTRLHEAVSRRLGPDGRDRWAASVTGLEAALAETVALAADDVLLDDLLGRLAQVPDAADLLLGVSVYREPVDRNAVLFQVGQPDETAEDIPDRAGAYQRITEILAAAGITPGNTLDLADVPEDVRALLAPHLTELNRRPVPPFQPPPGLLGQAAACQAASLLTVGDGGQPRFFVHRWTATELAERAEHESEPRLADVHRQAARYWLWRVQVWPQDRDADLHDQLEARHHLLQAHDTDDADQVALSICDQLHTQGAWDQEASLIHDSLARLAADSPQRIRWILQLGVLAEACGAYDEAARQFQSALSIFERLGDQVGMADSYHQLGNVAYMRADYEQANHHYQRALDIRERFGDQAGMADSYGQLGLLARRRGDYDEATRQFQRALDIHERLGDQAKMATGYHNLGTLAHSRGDYDEAARQFQRALDIHERLGDQAHMATGYHNLGILAQDRGDYDGATREYRRALDISERLGDRAAMAFAYSQFGNLEEERGGSITEAAAWHVKALVIRLRLGVPEALHNLRRLAAYRRELGAQPFDSLLTQAAGDTDLNDAIVPLLDQVAETGDSSA